MAASAEWRCCRQLLLLLTANFPSASRWPSSACTVQSAMSCLLYGHFTITADECHIILEWEKTCLIDKIKERDCTVLTKYSDERAAPLHNSSKPTVLMSCGTLASRPATFALLKATLPCSSATWHSTFPFTPLCWPICVHRTKCTKGVGLSHSRWCTVQCGYRMKATHIRGGIEAVGAATSSCSELGLQQGHWMMAWWPCQAKEKKDVAAAPAHCGLPWAAQHTAWCWATVPSRAREHTRSNFITGRTPRHVLLPLLSSQHSHHQNCMRSGHENLLSTEDHRATCM